MSVFRRKLLMINRGENPIEHYESSSNILAFWDGIQNTFNGHSSNPAVWEDLTGNGYDMYEYGTRPTGWAWGSNGFSALFGISNYQYCWYSLPIPSAYTSTNFGYLTVELVFHINSSYTGSDVTIWNTFKFLNPSGYNNTPPSPATLDPTGTGEPNNNAYQIVLRGAPQGGNTVTNKIDLAASKHYQSVNSNPQIIKTVPYKSINTIALLMHFPYISGNSISWYLNGSAYSSGVNKYSQYKQGSFAATSFRNAIFGSRWMWYENWAKGNAYAGPYGPSGCDITVHCCRIYNKHLTAAEVTANHAVDVDRFS